MQAKPVVKIAAPPLVLKPSRKTEQMDFASRLGSRRFSVNSVNAGTSNGLGSNQLPRQAARLYFEARPVTDRFFLIQSSLQVANLVSLFFAFKYFPIKICLNT